MNRLFNKLRNKFRNDSHDDGKNIANEIKNDPLDPRGHYKLAQDAAHKGNLFLASAAIKSAKLAGLSQQAYESFQTGISISRDDLLSLDHNQFVRYTAIADEIKSTSSDANCSVLDIGGGIGTLSAFLPDYDYFLIEPTVNGLTAEQIPFPDKSFSYVTACHVFEHIEKSLRANFLDLLISKAQNGVLLLNPFDLENTSISERLELFIDITNAWWAKEHLYCTMPVLNDILDYAKERGLSIKVKPNGSMVASTCHVFMSHFAGKSGSGQELTNINSYLNRQPPESFTSETYPNSYMIYIDLQSKVDN